MAANPEYNPSGVGDCIDTNKLPWIPIPNAPGMSISLQGLVVKVESLVLFLN